MENEKDVFHYTYSAKQQSEIESIRKKYLPAEEDKMEQLRRLDRSASQKGNVISLITGILGSLVLGTGMCCCMVWMDKWLIPGILIGIVGIAMITAAYPLYMRITRKEREKIAPEVIRLTDELMK